MESLKNKIVFITGATSGIGKACAEAFAKEGANLILCARREKLLKTLSDELTQKNRIKIFSGKVDVRNKGEVDKFVESFPPEFKKVDILINNAGLSRGLEKFYDDDHINWEEMIDTNVKGLLYVTKAVIPLMLSKGEGLIINIGSIAGREAYPKGAVYCASKHAVYAITKSLRMDLIDKNIRVSTIDPGMVETEFSKVRFRGDEEKAANVYKGLTPLTGKDIAETAVFIACRPKHVNISDVVIFPSRQASATIVHRD